MQMDVCRDLTECSCEHGLYFQYFYNNYRWAVRGPEAGGRVGFYRPSPELCRDVHLTSSHPRWKHSPILLVMNCLVLSSLSLATDTCHHFPCPSCFLFSLPFLPLSLSFLHISQVPHKEACLWNHCLLLRLHLGQASLPSHIIGGVTSRSLAFLSYFHPWFFCWQVLHLTEVLLPTPPIIVFLSDINLGPRVPENLRLPSTLK